MIRQTQQWRRPRKLKIIRSKLLYVQKRTLIFKIWSLVIFFSNGHNFAALWAINYFLSQKRIPYNVLNLPWLRSSGFANPTSNPILMHAQTNSIFSMKSSRAFMKKVQKGVRGGISFLFVPKCYSLISRSTDVRPMSRLTLSFSLRPAIPISIKKA